MKTLITLLALASVSLVTPVSEPAAATADSEPIPTCHDIDVCWVGYESGDEMEQGPVGSHTAAPTFFHTDCRSCSGTCHDLCTPEDEEDVQEAYAEVMEAITQGDQTAIVQALPLLQDYAVWNADRGAVQFLSCDKSYLAASYVLSADHAEQAWALLEED